MELQVVTRKSADARGPRIGVIIPTLNDVRIVQAICSIILRDPGNLTRIYVIDGGSRPEIVQLVERQLRPHDRLRSEPDQGIFDALNKGLDLIEEDIVGWIGSDDFYTRAVDFPAIVKAFDAENLDCCAYDLIFVDDGKTKRRTRAFAATLGNMRLGRHVQHFSSFWRRARIGATRFDLRYNIAADIDFFGRLALPEPPKTKLDHTVVTVGRLGGNSTKDLMRIVHSNVQVFHIFRKHMSAAGALFATLCKLSRKSFSQITGRSYPVVDELTDLVVKTRTPLDMAPLPNARVR